MGISSPTSQDSSQSTETSGSKGMHMVAKQQHTDMETGEVLSTNASQSVSSSAQQSRQGNLNTEDTLHCDISNCDSQSEARTEHQSEAVLQQTNQSDTVFHSDMSVDQSNQSNQRIKDSDPPESQNPSESGSGSCSDERTTLGPISVDTGHHHVTFDLREFHDHPQVSPQSSRSPSATLTGDEVAPDTDFSDQEGTSKAVKVRFGMCSPVKIKKKPKYFPLDISAVLDKVGKAEYATVVSAFFS